MNGERQKSGLTPEEERIQREIRSRRPFSLGEAIGREGAFFLKGESPVARLKQLELGIKAMAEQVVNDPEGALLVVLQRRVHQKAPRFVDDDLSPSQSLSVIVEGILQNETTLSEFVREIDAEWGRLYDERPHFDRPGNAPDKDDPYTQESVRSQLEELKKQL